MKYVLMAWACGLLIAAAWKPVCSNPFVAIMGTIILTLSGWFLVSFIADLVGLPVPF